MKRVMASGVFDVIHPGHLHYLSEAKRHGDHLVVVVASDPHATGTKRSPLHSAAERAALVKSLEIVDEVQLGAEPYDLVATVRAAAPDVIALGFDQPYEEGLLKAQLAEVGIVVDVVRIPKLPGSQLSTRDL